LVLALIRRRSSSEVGRETSAIGVTGVRLFVLAFFIAGFLMKIVGEVVHELLGHGSFVLLFGGQVTDFYISLIWPYELSYVIANIPNASHDQMAWVGEEVYW